MIDLSLHLLFYFTFIYIHTQGAAQIHEIVTGGKALSWRVEDFFKKRWRRGYTKQEGRRWLTAKGEKREVRILLLGGKGSTQELMNWEQGVNERGRNRPVKGQKKKSSWEEKESTGGEKMRWRGGAQCHGRQIKQKSSYHFASTDISFVYNVRMRGKDKEEVDKQCVMKETTDRLIEVR